jgi:hypothetical protein
MSIKLAEGAEDAVFTREQIMFRELYRDYYELTDRIGSVAKDVSAFELAIKGTENQHGLFDLMKLASSELAQHAGAVNSLGNAVGEVPAMLEAFRLKMLQMAEDRQVVLSMTKVMQEAARETLPGIVAMQSKLLDSVSLKAFGEAADLKASADQALQDLEGRDETIRVLRESLSAGSGAAQHLRKVFFDETERLAKIYTERGNALAIVFDEETTKAVNKIKAQNAWLPLKYAFCAAVAFVAGFAMHDPIYSQITKFMQ